MAQDAKGKRRSRLTAMWPMWSLSIILWPGAARHASQLTRDHDQFSWFASLIDTYAKFWRFRSRSEPEGRITVEWVAALERRQVFGKWVYVSKVGR